MRINLFKNIPWFPLLVALLLAGLSSWLSQIVQVKKPSLDGSDRHDPDYIVEKFVATRMGPDGVPIHVLSAEKMQHYPDTDETELSNAHLIQYTPGLPDEHLTAKFAIVNKAGRQMQFDKGVTVSRAATAKKPALTIYTTKMTVWPDDKKMDTDAVIVLTEGATKITAQGLTYFQNSKKVIFKHKVRVVLQKGRS